MDRATPPSPASPGEGVLASNLHLLLQYNNGSAFPGDDGLDAIPQPGYGSPSPFESSPSPYPSNASAGYDVVGGGFPPLPDEYQQVREFWWRASPLTETRLPSHTARPTYRQVPRLRPVPSAEGETA